MNAHKESPRGDGGPRKSSAATLDNADDTASPRALVAAKASKLEGFGSKATPVDRRVLIALGDPTEVRQVEDAEDARRTALTLNLARRHLDRWQRRELIATEIDQLPEVDQ